jgi:glucose-6-phosphate 1-dehydrogenase
MPGVEHVSLSAVTGKSHTGGPFVLVIFGASGDLTQRKLIPAVFGLFCDKLLDEKVHVVGFARTQLSDEQFRQRLAESTQKYSDRPWDAQAWDRFAGRLTYHTGSYDRAEDFAHLRQRLEQLTRELDMPSNYLFYLSTPPEQFSLVARQLDDAGLSRRGGNSSEGWSRIVTEKPFGTDLESARRLNKELLQHFDERQIFRIDHYLGKETVQNLLVLRFANAIFEPMWNYKYVDHVQITVAETVGVGSRASYYDQSGALRDMLQNHMMNLLCLVAMEPPTTLGADDVRNEKVKVLRALRPIPPDCAMYGVVRAQYAAGQIDGKDVPGYLWEPGVNPDSMTETYVALKVNIDNWRWSGVPFYLRTGKRLPRRITEIVIQFRPVPQVLFNAPPLGPQQPNLLIVRIQPDEGVSLRFQVKQPGQAMQTHAYTMDFSYAQLFGRRAPEAYERLLLDAAAGDSTLFIRSDEIEAAWTFVSPILAGCDLLRRQRLPQYPAGSWGPKQADELIANEGARWIVSP